MKIIFKKFLISSGIIIGATTLLALAGKKIYKEYRYLKYRETLNNQLTREKILLLLEAVEKGKLKSTDLNEDFILAKRIKDCEISLPEFNIALIRLCKRERIPDSYSLDLDLP